MDSSVGTIYILPLDSTSPTRNVCLLGSCLKLHVTMRRILATGGTPGLKSRLPAKCSKLQMRFQIRLASTVFWTILCVVRIYGTNMPHVHHRLVKQLVGDWLVDVV